MRTRIVRAHPRSRVTCLGTGYNPILYLREGIEANYIVE